MRNPEKSALRKQFRRARAQMSADERNTATETINRLLKPYIKKGRKIGVYWPMGKELRLDGFVRAAQKRGAKLYLPYIEPHTRRMWFTPYPADGAKQERKRGRAKLSVPQLPVKKSASTNSACCWFPSSASTNAATASDRPAAITMPPSPP